jgi:hypothetical protein
MCAFDHAGERLIAVTGRLNMIHVWDWSTGRSTAVPRPVYDGNLLQKTLGLIGVRGGFVVAGLMDDQRLIAAHYDFALRQCAAHDLGPPPGLRGSAELDLELRYDPRIHAVWFWNRAADPSHRGSALDLFAPPESACFRAHLPTARTSKSALAAALHGPAMPTSQVRVMAGGLPLPPGKDAVRLDSVSGQIGIRINGEWAQFIPQSDGRPALRGRGILQARHAGRVVALLTARMSAPRSQRIVGQYGGDRMIHLHEFPTGAFLAAVPALPDESDFTLSPDGRWLARRVDAFRLDVHDLAGRGASMFSTEREKVHDRLVIAFRERELRVGSGDQFHAISWGNAPDLIVSTYRETLAEPSPALNQAPIENLRRFAHLNANRKPLSWVRDSSRFYELLFNGDGLFAVADILGNVVVFGGDGELLVIFNVFRSRVSAWMPDGTSLGPPSTGPEAKQGRERIARVLRSAEKRILPEARVSP